MPPPGWPHQGIRSRTGTRAQSSALLGSHPFSHPARAMELCGWTILSPFLGFRALHCPTQSEAGKLSWLQVRAWRCILLPAPQVCQCSLSLSQCDVWVRGVLKPSLPPPRYPNPGLFPVLTEGAGACARSLHASHPIHTPSHPILPHTQRTTSGMLSLLHPADSGSGPSLADAHAQMHSPSMTSLPWLMY